MTPLVFIAQLPSNLWLVVVCLFVWILWGSHRKIIRLAMIALLSFAWASMQGSSMIEQTLTLVGANREVIASVQSINLGQGDAKSQFFKIEKVDGKQIFPVVLFRAKWGGAETPLSAGQKWKFIASLRPVHSLLNEGGFDAQRWALAQHAPLTATIRQGEMLEGGSTFRQQFIHRVQAAMPELANTPVLIALAFGEKGLINGDEKILLQRTGVAHLVAISGLHIGIAALFGWWVARGMQFFLPVKQIDYRFPLLVSEIFLLMYTWLSGCNAPALRAALAVSLWIMLRFFRISCHPWQVWLWGVALLLLADPMNILSDSFWLSCFAVGSLVFWFQWMPLSARFQHDWYWFFLRWGHLQAGMTLLLLPLQVAIFHGLNPSSFLANMWAVPIVSMVTVPLVLMLLIFNLFPSGWMSGMQIIFWKMADHTLSLAMWGVKSFSDSWFTLAGSFLIISFTGWLAVLFWRMSDIRHRLSLLISLGVVSLCWVTRMAPERWRVDMLDVGHGLSVLISKNGKGILYDTGNRWEGGSAAEQNIAPLLRGRNIRLEQIIISHDDMDHRGGLEILQAMYPKASLRDSSYSAGHLSCIAGEHWKWEGLNFNILWPLKSTTDARNDDSCVIRVDDGTFSLLLTGDIEAGTEKALIKKERKGLQSTWLQVPHHGSNTSSSPPFLRAVQPVMAMASAARFNKWHLPAHKVVSRYIKARYDWHSTSVSGQLSIFIYNDYWAIKGLREQLIPRWYHHRFGVSEDNE
ncbi:DNA internalization-related competence protein ComEC/Rec2 [Enterobacteriaceae bacterium Kacie_13]|nr:DNA internalization-related competence protein ComEC/Rec2 [Enterobacteriaceae bacterium Kacie_13]